MRDISFTNNSWEEYLYWQNQDKKTLKKINNLLEDITRNAFIGIGKPEPLKGVNGLWSRRIDDANRLVYRVSNEKILVVQCKGHYEDK